MSAPATPSIFTKINEYVVPLEIYLALFMKGVFPTLLYMATHPLQIVFPSAWRDSFLRHGQPYLLAVADKMYAPFKRKLVEQAKGRVLEVGAGTGQTVKYYDRAKVDVVFGVEPNLAALGELRGEVLKHGLSDKYEILPFGVEDEMKMSEAGVTPGSIDTIVCMMCLCSVPTPEKVISALYPLLKPGGTIILFEHVASEHPLPYFVQWTYTNFGWRYILDGCELNRPTGKFLLDSGNVSGRKGWKEIELSNLPDEGWWSVIPHLVGKMVKA